MSSYDFKMLSWVDFEELCRDLVASEFDCHVESFKWGPDGGVDLRYTINSKETIVQCKHYANSDFRALYRELEKELAKLKKINPPFYRVITSLPLGYFQKAKIYSLFKKYMPSKDFIWGRDDINGALGKSKNTHVEERHYKLWLTSTKILKKILHRKTYVATDFNLSNIKEEIKLYVDNESFPQALKILHESHALIISGPPGVGKTTLANMLMYHYIGKGFEPTYITGNVDEIYNVIDSDQKQVIVFDDFLGQFRLEASRFGNVDRRVHDLLNVVEKSNKTRFILTTREHILKQAQGFSEHLSSKNINYLKYVLDVGAYTRYVKAKILYNHLKYSSLPANYLDGVLENGFYKKIIDHKAFNPRVISWLGKERFFKRVEPTKFQEKILEVLDDPTELWGMVYTSHLSEHAKNVLIAISTMEGESVQNVQRAFDLIHSEFSNRYNLNRGPADFNKGLAEVENSLVKISILPYRPQAQISFINPSLHEFIEGQWWNNLDTRKAVLQNLVTMPQLSTVAALIRESKLQKHAISEDIRVSMVRIVDLAISSGKKSDQKSVSLADKILWSLGDQISTEDKKIFLEKLMPSIKESAFSNDEEAKKISDLIKGVAYLVDLEDETFKEILNQLKSIMTEAAETWNFLEIHAANSAAIKEHEEHFTQDEIDMYESMCMKYIENAYDDYSERSLDELEEYKDTFSELMNSWGVFDENYLNNIDERMLELEEKMSDHQDYEGKSSDAQRKEENVSDKVLDSLFSSLKINRD